MNLGGGGDDKSRRWASVLKLARVSKDDMSNEKTTLHEAAEVPVWGGSGRLVQEEKQIPACGKRRLPTEHALARGLKMQT
jgi:hypothetical protein